MSRLERVFWIPLALAVAGCMLALPSCERLKPEGSSSSNVFPHPEKGDGQRLGSSGQLLPDSEATVCAASAVDTDNWIEQPTAVPAEGLGDVTLRLPQGYWARSITFGPDEAVPASDHLLGIWEVPRPGTASKDETQLAVWISSSSAYPTVATAPGTRQSDFSECQMRIGGQTMFVVEFALGMGPADDTYYVAAVWPAGRAGWLTAEGSARTRHAQAEIRAIFESLRFSVRPA